MFPFNTIRGQTFSPDCISLDSTLMYEGYILHILNTKTTDSTFSKTLYFPFVSSVSAQYASNLHKHYSVISASYGGGMKPSLDHVNKIDFLKKAQT